MPVTFRILPQRSLVYIRYFGQAHVAEGFQAFSAYMQHPECRPGQRQFVDLSAVTGLASDFADLLRLQAFKADQFVGSGPQTMLVYYAPGPEAQKMAHLILRSWDAFSHIIARVMTDEAEALAFLGLPERRLSDLLAET